MGKPKAVGVDMVHVAKLTDDQVGKVPTYGTPTAIPSAVQMEVSINSNFNKFYADNGVDEVLDGVSGATIGFQVGGLTLEELNLLQAVETPANGGALSDMGKMSGYVALAYRRMMTGTTDDGRQRYRYVWIYKVKFAPPGDTTQTRADTTTVQPDTLSGECAALDAYKPDHAYWRYTYDNWADGASSELDKAFFTAVKGLPQISPAG